MFLDFRIHIICIAITFFILIHYCKKINLHLESTKSFKKILIAAMVNFLFSGITEYTVNYRHTIDSNINDIAHMIFFLSIIFTGLYKFDYINSYISINKPVDINIKTKLRNVFVVISVIGVILFPIDYADSEFLAHSYGPKVYFLYCSVLTIAITEIITLVRNKSYIPVKLYNALKNGLTVALAASFIQLVIPYLLISNFGIILEIIILYISLEEPDKYIDTDTETFNMDALRLVLKEQIYLNTDKNLYLYYNIKSTTNQQVEYIQNQISTSKKKHYLYKISDNVFGIISSKKPTFTLSTIVDEDYVEIKDMKIIGEKINKFITKNSHDELYIDKMTNVFNRNKYELDIKNQIQNEDLWYIMVDLNNLKKTNDTLGHDKGDELIKDMVYLLKENFDKDSIYRFGGDEFVILSKDKEISKKIQELKERSVIFNQANKKEVEFALGFAKYIHGKSNWESVVQTADKEMYFDKKKIKAKKQALS